MIWSSNLVFFPYVIRNTGLWYHPINMSVCRTRQRMTQASINTNKKQYMLVVLELLIHHLQYYNFVLTENSPGFAFIALVFNTSSGCVSVVATAP
jgi:hypothetical protein